MPLEYELAGALTQRGFSLKLRHQGTTGSSSGVMMPKLPKLAAFSRVARPARARPMAHRIGGRTQTYI